VCSIIIIITIITIITIIVLNHHFVRQLTGNANCVVIFHRRRDSHVTCFTQIDKGTNRLKCRLCLLYMQRASSTLYTRLHIEYIVAYMHIIVKIMQILKLQYLIDDAPIYILSLLYTKTPSVITSNHRIADLRAARLMLPLYKG